MTDIPTPTMDPVWLTRGMNARDEWMPWTIITETAASRWKSDVTYRNGRRQVEMFTSARSGGGDVVELQEALEKIAYGLKGCPAVHRKSEMERIARAVLSRIEARDETDEILATAHKMAARMGAVFIEEPDKIAAFRSPIPHPAKSDSSTETTHDR